MKKLIMLNVLIAIVVLVIEPEGGYIAFYGFLAFSVCVYLRGRVLADRAYRRACFRQAKRYGKTRNLV